MTKRQRGELARALDEEDEASLDALPRIIVDTLVRQLETAQDPGKRRDASSVAAVTRRMRDAVRSSAWWCERVRALYAPWVDEHDAPLDARECVPTWLAGSARLGSGRAYAAWLTRVYRWCAANTTPVGNTFAHDAADWMYALHDPDAAYINAEPLDDPRTVVVRTEHRYTFTSWLLPAEELLRAYFPGATVDVCARSLRWETGDASVPVLRCTNYAVPGPNFPHAPHVLWDARSSNDAVHVVCTRATGASFVVSVTTDVRVPRDEFLRAWSRLFVHGGHAHALGAPVSGLENVPTELRSAVATCFERSGAPRFADAEFFLNSTAGWPYLTRVLTLAWLVTLVHSRVERARRLGALVRAVDALSDAEYAALT